MKRIIASISLLIATLCVSAETAEDPWEGFNRSMFAFNETVDEYGLKPLAKGYDAVTPNFMQKGVSNFFSNLGEVPNLFNNLLQGKLDETASSTFRFIINSTFGIFGLFDVASEMGLKHYKEDFGQTLGHWGISSGPYLVIPFLGPSTVRDASGMVVDYSIYDAMDFYDFNDDQKWISRGLNVVQVRARYLTAERMVFGDRYSFLRDVYLQTRVGEIEGGMSEQEYNDSSIQEPNSWSEDSQDSWESSDSWDDTDSWGEEY
ncbi:VacJ family lipoprotein [Marinomonas ostreistagni]|uniref:VacJ family lipoprotein n=1 Tax=Marinomonas ostreistagni TaxID=359209 RepID=A0ABS0ZFS8_9GAMM|nr:VacJ family lipoprotein [Marinomonas ostreistagni]MBJ7552511.1 VacJ family lipoprotein [Marinomonas ostreistagni]